MKFLYNTYNYPYPDWLKYVIVLSSTLAAELLAKVGRRPGSRMASKRGNDTTIHKLRHPCVAFILSFNSAFPFSSTSISLLSVSSLSLEYVDSCILCVGIVAPLGWHLDCSVVLEVSLWHCRICVNAALTSWLYHNYFMFICARVDLPKAFRTAAAPTAGEKDTPAETQHYLAVTVVLGLYPSIA